MNCESAKTWFDYSELFSTLLMGGLTVWIAWRQWRLTGDIADREARSAAVAIDADRERAHNVVWAEWWRIWALSSDWARQDLLSLASAGLLDPDIVLPRDWSAATASAAVMGVFPARWVGSAFNEAYNVRASLQILNAAFEMYSWDTLHNAQHLEKLDQLRSRESQVKDHLLEVANILQDALDEDPRINMPRKFSHRESYHSKLVTRLANEIANADVNNPRRPTLPE
jgi:ABC-type nickel/cobalt efflux system permease component RcnA